MNTINTSLEAGISDEVNDSGETSKKVEGWLQLRKDEAGRIDPETAEVYWTYAQTLDPYGVHGDLPEECWQVGREYFARAPGSEIWVWFGDLPDGVCTKLWEKHRTKLAFPAGVEDLRAFMEQFNAGHRPS